MQRSNIILILFSTFLVLTSCTYETDMGLNAKNNANLYVKDLLKGKANPEKLKFKYEKLSMNCGLTIESNKPVFEAPLELKPMPLPNSPVSNDGLKTSFDLLGQLAIDPELKSDQNDSLMVVENSDSRISVQLKIKPVVFVESLNHKVGSFVYLLKHSPILTMSYVFTAEGTQRKSVHEGTFIESLYEQIPFKQPVGREIVGSTDNSYYVTCNLNGEINQEHKDALYDQWLAIDCAKDPKPEFSTLHNENCKNGMPVDR